MPAQPSVRLFQAGLCRTVSSFGGIAISCALFLSGCLVGEKEPGVITASLNSASSSGCLDDLESNAMAAMEGDLSEPEIRRTADCTRTAIQGLIRQIEGKDTSQSLNAAEFRSFLNGMLFRSHPLTQEQANRLLKFKSYFLGGSDRSWADSDSRSLIPLVTLVEEELVYWVPLIREFRSGPDIRSWQRLKARSDETAVRIQSTLLETSGETTLSASDLTGMFEDVVSRLEAESDFRRPAWMSAIDSAVKLLLRGKFLLAGGGMNQLEPESRAKLAALAIRLAPYAIGKSIAEEGPLSRYSRFLDGFASRNGGNAASLGDYLVDDALKELPSWIEPQGESLPLPTLIQWARELPAALTPASLSDFLPQIEKWLSWIKPLSIGGEPDSFSRRDLRRSAILAAEIVPAVRGSGETIDPRPLLEAFLRGWDAILSMEPDAAAQTVTEKRVVSLLEKVSREEWEQQPAPGILAGAVRLARFSLEGPSDGSALNEAMTWERWLEMLRVASVIQGPGFDQQRTPEANIDLLQEILGKVVEGSRCSHGADQPCIPLSEIHSFFLAGKKNASARPLTLAEAGAVKQLLLGGSSGSVSWQELRALRGTLARLRPALLEGLAGDFDSAWFSRHLRRFWSETALRHPNGIPASALRLILDAGFAELDLKSTANGLPLADLVLITLTGTALSREGTFPLAAWTTLGETLAGWTEAWFLAPENVARSCRGLSARDRLLAQPDCWSSLRKRISNLPSSFSGKRLPWSLVDQWLQVGALNGWLPDGAAPEELSHFLRALAAGLARSSLEQRGKGISQKALSRMVETTAELLPVLASARELARNPRTDAPEFWLQVEAELVRWRDAMDRLEPLFSLGTGIPLWSYAEMLEALPANWLRLDRKLVLASSGPFFQRIWVCQPGEAFCPTGLSSLLDSLQDNVRMEYLAARFAEERIPETESPLRERWMKEAESFGSGLAPASDRSLWNRWIETAREYPDYFKTPTGQALFVPSNAVHALNVRTFFHLSTAADLVLAAYSDSGTSRPLAFPAFVQVADDFDDLAKAFKIIENRTPELAPTRFREANLFSHHGNGDEWLDRREMTGYLALIWSGKTFTNRVVDRLTPLCALSDGSTDTLGRPILDMPCFRAHLTRELRGDLLDHFPGLLEDWGRWNPGEEQVFVNAMELAGREKAHGDEPISINDIDGITGLLQYLESLVIRFDHDSDGALNETEIHEMFPVVRATIAAAVIAQGSESIAENAAMLESLFTWVLTRKSLPRGPLPMKFLQWHQNRNTRKFTIRRLDAMVAIAVLIGPPVEK